MKSLKILMAVLAGILISAVTALGAAKPGEPAPDFTLTDSNGEEHSLSDFEGKYVVLEWLNHNCPFVKKHYNSNNMQELQKKWTGKDVVWLSINSSAEDHKDYKTPEETNAQVEKHGAAPTAVLLDASGEVGKSYGATSTPHMFVINPEGQVIYAGAIDSDSSADPASIEGATNYVSEALEAAMAGEDIETAATKPYGCSIKYAKG